MKKPRGKKRRKKKRRGKRARHTMKARANRIELRIDRLELARGHDGFMRGTPEPVIVCGVFSITQSTTKLVSRGIAHFEQPSGSYPCATAHAGAVAKARVPALEGACIAIVALAFEEDRGTDVQQAYAALERAHSIALFDESASEPTPIELCDLASDPLIWAEPRTVHLMVDGTHFTSDDDDWVSGVALAVHTRGEHSTHRAHFVSANGRNDWTAELELWT